MSVRRSEIDGHRPSPGVADHARSEESFFRGVFDAAPDGLALVDAEGRIVEVNQRLEELSGYRRHELVWHPIEILVPEELRVAHQRDRHRFWESPHVRHMGLGLRLSLRRRDGTLVPVDVGLAPARGPKGEPLVIAAVRDDTARRSAEEALRASERRLAESQALAHLGSWEWDIRRDEIHWTEEVFRIFGLPPDAGPLPYEGFLSMVHPEDRGTVDAAVRTALETGGDYAVDHRVIRPDGLQRVVHEQGQVHHDGDGVPVRMVGTVLDITERYRMEQELELQYERLRKLDAERRRLLAHLIRAREEEAARIAGDIHDDPLQKMAALALRVSMLRERLGDPESLRRLDTVEATVAQVIRSLRTLLFELRPSVLDQQGLAEALRELGGRLAADRAVAFALEDRMATEPPLDSRVVCYRIASEALSNALKHARASRIEVSLISERSGTRVVIRDDGVGFDPNGVRMAPGHLGLVSMRERAELAGGRFAVTSTPGAGTTVDFWIPLQPTGVGAA
jgi:PAS domain S-box-containing protein